MLESEAVHMIRAYRGGFATVQINGWFETASLVALLGAVSILWRLRRMAKQAEQIPTALAATRH